MLYFSGGLTRQGIENQASMRAATNEAVKANMAIYSVDSRGLEAVMAVGNASTGSLRGTAAYSGASMQSNLQSNFSSQETLGTLASDTGGKLFTDSNDFAPAFQQIQHDTEAYYIIGFRSTNPARDGSFRHLTVKLNRSDAKLEYRPGYYAPADFQHSKTEDREVQLNEQLRSDLPATDVAVYLQALYFRLEDNRFYVPVSLIVPGSQIPFLKNGDRDKANLDIIGLVKELTRHQRRQCPRHRQARPRRLPAGPAPQHPVLDRIHPRAGPLSPQVCRPREPDRPDGLLRDRPQRPRPQEISPQTKLHRPRQPARAQHRQKKPTARWFATASSGSPTSPTSSARINTSSSSTRSTIPPTAKTIPPPTPEPRSPAAPPSAASASSPRSSSCSTEPRSTKHPLVEATSHQLPRPRRRSLPVRRSPHPAQTRHLCLPDQRHRRRRRQLQLPPPRRPHHRPRTRHRKHVSSDTQTLGPISINCKVRYGVVAVDRIELSTYGL